MNEVKLNMLRREKDLSKYACLDKEAIRFKPLNDNDIRPNYFRDTDRIIYSLSYERYIDKTQVFSNITNDHISKRIIHVQLVSKIARTIGRALNLNEDLIEAIALGHDIGHVPFGHVGERILNQISLDHYEGPIMHNAQSARTMMEIDRNGNGNNLTLQVLDGILCHNGEFVQGEYYPKEKTVEDFLNDYHKCFEDQKWINKLIPMTLEGCVVRISDIIGYLGRDIEDAVRLGLLKEDEIPSDIVDVLGRRNTDMINTIILDIVKNSYGKNYIELSSHIYEAIKKLKDFNYENIYYKANSKEAIIEFENMFNLLFETYLKDLKENSKKTSIYKMFLDDMTDEYINNNSKERQVIDYIAGMTDDYFKNEYTLIKKNR